MTDNRTGSFEGEPIEVKIIQIRLVIDETEKALTKNIAKQLPVKPYIERKLLGSSGVEAPDPICKILAKTILGESAGHLSWLLLIDDEELGLAWTAPAHFNNPDLLPQGGWVDDLTTIPTAILV